MAAAGLLTSAIPLTTGCIEADTVGMLVTLLGLIPANNWGGDETGRPFVMAPLTAAIAAADGEVGSGDAEAAGISMGYY
jgi:hypothetical protein